MDTPDKYLRAELAAYKQEFGFMKKIPCTREENKQYKELIKTGEPLPDGVYSYKTGIGEPTGEFYTIYVSDMSEKETAELIMFKQLSMIKTIKNCVVFFTTVAVIALAIYLFMFLLSAFS